VQQPPPPDFFFESGSGQVLAVGRYAIGIHHTPGHSPGGVSGDWARRRRGC
jgi:glyoxylase-like metal-dependent hydrolase (beta-lactamase superfamily II)